MRRARLCCGTSDREPSTASGGHMNSGGELGDTGRGCGTCRGAIGTGSGAGLRTGGAGCGDGDAAGSDRRGTARPGRLRPAGKRSRSGSVRATLSVTSAAVGVPRAGVARARDGAVVRQRAEAWGRSGRRGRYAATARCAHQVDHQRCGAGAREEQEGEDDQQPQAPDRGLARDGPTVVDAVGDRRGLARRGRVEDLALACPLVAVRRGRWREDVSPRERNRAGSEVVAWLEHDLWS